MNLHLISLLVFIYVDSLYSDVQHRTLNASVNRQSKTAVFDSYTKQKHLPLHSTANPRNRDFLDKIADIDDIDIEIDIAILSQKTSTSTSNRIFSF